MWKSTHWRFSTNCKSFWSLCHLWEVCGSYAQELLFTFFKISNNFIHSHFTIWTIVNGLTHRASKFYCSNVFSVPSKSRRKRCKISSKTGQTYTVRVKIIEKKILEQIGFYSKMCNFWWITHDFAPHPLRYIGWGYSLNHNLIV